MNRTDPYNVISGLKKDLNFARKLIAIAAWLGLALGLFSGKFIKETKYQLNLTEHSVKFREFIGETNGY